MYAFHVLGDAYGCPLNNQCADGDRMAGRARRPGLAVTMVSLMTIAVMSIAGLVAAQDAAGLPPIDSEGDLEILTRGPLHEAFAEVHTENAEPGVIVDKAPPDPLDEIPPEHKPEGEDVVWIPGYWAWDEDRDDFIWISGVWRRVPPGRSWVPGYWREVQGGRQWISGFWASADQNELEYLPVPPASVESGPSSPAPGDRYFYVPGCWRYVDGSYLWRAGFWSPLYDDWTWVPHRYVWTPRGCIYRGGYWDYVPQRRGVLFAPICFRGPRTTPWRHRYTPSCVIDVGPAFLVHLFIRPRYCHYYYGDYYAARYRQHQIVPWVSCWSRHRVYDPLFAYYYYHRGRRDAVIHRAHAWHQHFDKHEAHRPATTLLDQQRRPHAGDHTRVSSLGRDLRDVVRESPGGRHFVHLNQARREQFREQFKPLGALERQRAAVETGVTREEPGGSQIARPDPLKLRLPELSGAIGQAMKPQAGRGQTQDGRLSREDVLRRLSSMRGENRDRQPNPLAGRDGPRDLDKLRERLGARAGDRQADAARDGSQTQNGVSERDQLRRLTPQPDMPEILRQQRSPATQGDRRKPRESPQVRTPGGKPPQGSAADPNGRSQQSPATDLRARMELLRQRVREQTPRPMPQEVPRRSTVQPRDDGRPAGGRMPAPGDKLRQRLGSPGRAGASQASPRNSADRPPAVRVSPQPTTRSGGSPSGARRADSGGSGRSLRSGGTSSSLGGIRARTPDKPRGGRSR